MKQKDKEFIKYAVLGAAISVAVTEAIRAFVRLNKYKKDA